MSRCNKNNQKSKSCHEIKKIKYLKTKTCCSQNATLKNAAIAQLQAEIASIKQLTAENANIDNLNVTNLNGQNITCQKIFTNVNSDITRIEYGATGPIKPSGPGATGATGSGGTVNQVVWDFLWENSLLQERDLEYRLQCGRLQERLIQLKYNCPPSCPPDGYENCFPTCEGETGATGATGICGCPKEGVTGYCPIVPNRIWGIKTVAPFRDVPCEDSTVSRQLISTIAYNLDVVNVTEELRTRVVTILVQVGYINSTTQEFVYKQIDFGNRQFGPTYDTLYGEKYTGTVILPTDLITLMTEMMPDANNTAAVQLVVLAEDGVDIDIPLKAQVQTRDVAAPEGPVDTQFVNYGQTPIGPNIYFNYTSDIAVPVTTFSYNITPNTVSSSLKAGVKTGFLGGFDYNLSFYIVNEPSKIVKIYSAYAQSPTAGAGVEIITETTKPGFTFVKDYGTLFNQPYEFKIERTSQEGGINFWRVSFAGSMIGEFTTPMAYESINPATTQGFLEDIPCKSDEQNVAFQNPKLNDVFTTLVPYVQVQACYKLTVENAPNLINFIFTQ